MREVRSSAGEGEADGGDSREGLFGGGAWGVGQRGARHWEGRLWGAGQDPRGPCSRLCPTSPRASPPTRGPHLARQPLPHQAEECPTSSVSKVATTAPTLPNSSAYSLPPPTLDGPEVLPRPPPGHTVFHFSPSLRIHSDLPHSVGCQALWGRKRQGDFHLIFFWLLFKRLNCLGNGREGRFLFSFLLGSEKFPRAGGDWECIEAGPGEQGPAPASWQRSGDALHALGPCEVQGQRGSVPCLLGRVLERSRPRERDQI